MIYLFAGSFIMNKKKYEGKVFRLEFVDNLISALTYEHNFHLSHLRQL